MKLTNEELDKINIEAAGVIALNVVSNIEPKLTTEQEAFFIAGFQECIKYLTLPTNQTEKV